MARGATTLGRKLLMTSRALLNGLLLVVLFGVPLFLPAGTLRFWNAWAFLGIFAGFFVTILIYFSFTDPEYAEKRYRGNERENAQRLVMALLILSAIGMLIVAGFDRRFHWSSVPVLVVFVFSVLMVGAFALLLVVMRQNRYASRVVEIQEGQKLIDTGAYSIVRHPMYFAFAVIFLASPLVLGSLYSSVPAACIPFLLSLRIGNEEEVLTKGLAGFDDYKKRVTYRLVPFVW